MNADIADAAIRYLAATGDDTFEREAGLELLVETARLWHSLGHHDAEGRFRIDGVTGPDEYSAIADNNVYTNLVAQANLRAAADAVARHPRAAAELGVGFEETADWRDAAGAMTVPWDEMLRVHPQSEGFTRHEVWDFEHTKPEQYPLLLHFPYFDLYRKQVVKQADLVLALHWRGDAFTPEEKERNFAYYEALTVRDSSLSACTQAVIAAEVGHLDLAFDYFGEAALDRPARPRAQHRGRPAHRLAGGLLARGRGRLRRDARPRRQLTFAPRLPAQLDRLVFRLIFRGTRLRVAVTPAQATYTVLDGPPLEVGHYGETISVDADTPRGSSDRAGQGTSGAAPALRARAAATWRGRERVLSRTRATCPGTTRRLPSRLTATFDEGGGATMTVASRCSAGLPVEAHAAPLGR